MSDNTEIIEVVPTHVDESGVIHTSVSLGDHPHVFVFARRVRFEKHASDGTVYAPVELWECGSPGCDVIQLR